MALLNKLLNRKKTSKTSDCPGFLNSSRWKSPEFSKDRIRVLVFRECEWRGRKLLFDVDSIKKIDLNNQLANGHHGSETTLKPPPHGCQSDKRGGAGGHIEVTPHGIGYQYLRPRPDVKMLGEMIFGSVAMSYKGEAIKIHSIRSSSQLMLSRLFSAPVAIGRTKNGRDSMESNSLQNSLSESIPKSSSDNGICESLAQSEPVNVPTFTSSLHSDDDLECMASSSLRSNSTYDSFRSGTQRSPEGSNASLNSLTRSGSYNSLHRRWLRTQNTSMEFGIKRKSEENVNCNEKHMPSNSRTKLGVSVVVTLGSNDEEEKRLQAFFFSHIALIESYVNKLSMAVEQAYANRRQFVHSVMEATESLQQSLYDLYTAPRFPEPVWLSMMTHGTLQQPICSRFMTELMSLLEHNDCKTTNFFMSTLLTAVLTHHLAWVPTVTPPDILPKQSFYEKHTAKWLDMLAKLHPYNPLWVQLGDLYGALGSPCKIARTVIVGRNANLVKRILYCLTYFIRCCEVSENVEHRSVLSPRPQGMSVSSTSSGGTLVGDFGMHPPSTPSFTTAEETVKQTNSFNKSSSTFFYNLLNLQKSEQEEKLVERQDGEGEDEDDEVFLMEMKEKLRQKVACKSCMASCRCRRTSNRHGAIYNGVNVEDNKSTLVRVGTGHGQLCDTAALLGNEHDSGVDFLVDSEDKAKVRVVFSKERSKRKATNSKVTFTIGNIPLEEICSPLPREDDSNDSLVCTCGKHTLGKANKENLSEILRSKSKSESKTNLFGVNAKLLQMTNENMINNSAFKDDSEDRFSSNRCDSGIHSCDPSIVDLEETIPSVNLVANSVEALQINIPPMKLEHIRNVGKSLDAKKTIETVAEEEIKSKTNEVKSTRTFNYDRTNSMFDEYFDENVELKTLDEESFQQRMKMKREQQRRNKNDENPTKCVLNNGVLDSHDSLLQGQEDVCDSFESGNSDNGCMFNVNVRNVLWNSPPPPTQESYDFFDRVAELPLPKSEISLSNTNTSDYYHGFGWSLAANYTDHYMADFALQGTCQTDFGHQLLTDLKMAVSSPVLDEKVTEAVAIVADTDNWTVQLVTSRHGSVTVNGAPMGSRVMMSQLVAGITDSLLQLWNLKMSPEFCLMHLEDRLQELYFKSRVLAECTATMHNLDIKTMVQVLGVDTSDLPLLLGIASIHSSQDMCTSYPCT